MTIRDIVAAKGTRVETVAPDMRLDKVLRLLDERNIAAAVVVDKARHPLGMVFDRLLIRLLSRRGADALKLTAGEVMLTPAPHCSPETRVGQAMRMMTDERVRHLVVLSEDGIAGIVSIGDLVKSRLTDADLEARVLRELALSKLAAE